MDREEFDRASGAVAIQKGILHDVPSLIEHSRAYLSNVALHVPPNERRLLLFSWNRPWTVHLVARRDKRTAIVLCQYKDTERWLPGTMDVEYLDQNYVAQP